MNINSPRMMLNLTKALVRGSVVSIVDTERPVIETFTDGETLLPFAFLKGLPIPYSTFMLFMSIRFAPKRSQSMMAKNYEDGQFCMDREEHYRLTNLWSLCELPADIKQELGDMMRPWSANNLIRSLVDELYTKLQSGDDESAKTAFQMLIRRIDEDYVSSLIDPVKI